MFTGTYTHAVDPKGRLSIPKRFLDFFEEGQARQFRGTKGLDGCIFLMLEEEWRLRVEQVNQASLGNADARDFSRSFFGYARELPVDGSGRILLPPEYRTLLGLDKEAVLLGVNRRIELWNPELRRDKEERESATYEQQATIVFGS